MLVLFTDFGFADPYVGQMKARLVERAPGVAIIDLLHDVTPFNAHAGAQLLDALAAQFAPGSVFVCVVDPGVGTPRQALVLSAGGRWYVGPDNGLLSIVAQRASDARWWRITWHPDHLSKTFHGRDIFAPVAALIAAGQCPADWLDEIPAPEVEFDAGDLARVIHVDHYGNAWTGIRAANLPRSTRVRVGGREFVHAETFGQVGKGRGFWMANSSGLLEIAMNRGHAAREFGLEIGDRVEMLDAVAGRPRLN